LLFADSHRLNSLAGLHIKLIPSYYTLCASSCKSVLREIALSYDGVR